MTDVPENRIESKAIIPAEYFDVVILDTVSYPDMAVIEGKQKVDKVQEWADATEIMHIIFCRMEQPIFINDIIGTFQIQPMKMTRIRVLKSLGMTLPTVIIYGRQRNIISSPTSAPPAMWLKSDQKGVPDDIKKFIRRNNLPVPTLHYH